MTRHRILLPLLLLVALVAGQLQRGALPPDAAASFARTADAAPGKKAEPGLTASAGDDASLAFPDDPDDGLAQAGREDAPSDCSECSAASPAPFILSRAANGYWATAPPVGT